MKVDDAAKAYMAENWESALKTTHFGFEIDDERIHKALSDAFKDGSAWRARECHRQQHGDETEG